ncbi:MAG: site-specific DNA-methyltransferase [Candidatus Gastranaerophilales bacterium]|nr:site-specific DNA-methyltransferase [bacterium]MBR2068386.1 site-specific DNA-methyltransferase [Candidatus Gastranaerophilales bacterium]
MSKPLYSTKLGKYYIDKCENFIKHSRLQGKVQLILTSPPFPLNKKKKYGNFCGEEYKAWFVSLAPLFESLLTDNGSIVIEMGNSWEKGRPVQSLLHLKSLMEFVENQDASLRLCQEFICYNPARLPSPAEWVTVKKIRAIDSFTHIWWMSKNDYPKANNQRILRPYSKSMQKLLSSGKYNAGARPSEHKISEKSFLKENKGSISHNVLELSSVNGEDLRLPYSMLSIANTKSNDFYTRTCKDRNITPHPARMPLELASFFIDFLTDEGDIVFDPFGGSNTTGFCAEKANRKWISIEANGDYGKQSMIRFEDPTIKTKIKTNME